MPKVPTDAVLQAEIDQLDRLLSAKKEVQFLRQEVVRHERALNSWKAAFAASEQKLAELVRARAIIG